MVLALLALGLAVAAGTGAAAILLGAPWWATLAVMIGSANLTAMLVVIGMYLRGPPRARQGTGRPEKPEEEATDRPDHRQPAAR
jgi:heme A synthase